MTFAKRQTVAAMLIALITGPAAAQDSLPSVTDIVEAWLASPHADGKAEAFRHWDGEEAKEIPGTCATCHSGSGFVEFVRGDMAKAATLDHPVPFGSTVDCAACHNAASAALTAVPFPSGARLEGLGSSAVCSACHQGRASTGDVDAATATLEPDAVSSDLGFINVHYAAAAATLMGAAAHGGYEYQGKTYKGQFAHVPDFASCASCHNPHTLTVSLEQCTTCHKGVTGFGEIRTTPTDFLGDGDATKGIATTITAMQDRLAMAIQTYARDVAGTPVIYAADAYPYYFIDTNADGAVSDGEAAFPNRYQSWTPRLLKAAYNYQFVAKDTGAFAHNPYYALQLLYDSLESLSEKAAVDIAGLKRPQ
jgi:hypothetical protein